MMHAYPTHGMHNDETNNEPKRTLFLSGLPPDVKHREIHNLFRPFSGYEDSILKPNGIVFANFTNQDAATAARDALNVRKLVDPLC